MVDLGCQDDWIWRQLGDRLQGGSMKVTPKRIN